MHGRVKCLARIMVTMGWNVWLDEDQLLRGGDIGVGMVNGIDRSDVVLIFLSEVYMKKVNTGDMRDNVYKEFNYSVFTGKRIIPIVMDPPLLDLNNWPTGLSTMHLCNRLFVDGVSGSMMDVVMRIHHRLMCERMMPNSQKCFTTHTRRLLKKRPSRPAPRLPPLILTRATNTMPQRIIYV